MSRVRTIAVVTVGATVLATVGIQASDLASGVRGNLLGSAIDSTSTCGVGEVEMRLPTGAVCVDRYEAAPGSECPHADAMSPVHTQENLNIPRCAPVSAAEVKPWRFVSLAQAQQLCARAEKRLLKNEEWHALALGVTDQSACVVDGSAAAVTGSGCASTAGIHDVVGNVWEWIDAEVVDGTYNGRDLPESGYVSTADSAGIVVATAGSPGEEYGDDYAKTDSKGVYGVIRGGFYGSKSDAGIYAQNLAVPLDLKTNGVGFRCVRSL